MEEKKSDDNKNDINPSLVLYSATIAMCAIFLGFVFACLLALLTKDTDTVISYTWAIGLLITVLLFLFTALMLFHSSVKDEIFKFKYYFPNSRKRKNAVCFFVVGVFGMLCVIARLLLHHELIKLSIVVVVYSVLLLPFLFKLGYRGREKLE